MGSSYQTVDYNELLPHQKLYMIEEAAVYHHSLGRHWSVKDTEEFYNSLFCSILARQFINTTMEALRSKML